MSSPCWRDICSAGWRPSDEQFVRPRTLFRWTRTDWRIRTSNWSLFRTIAAEPSRRRGQSGPLWIRNGIRRFPCESYDTFLRRSCVYRPVSRNEPRTNQDHKWARPRLPTLYGPPGGNTSSRSPVMPAELFWSIGVENCVTLAGSITELR